MTDTSITLGIELPRQTWFREQFGWLTSHPPYLWQIEAFEALVQNQIPSALALPTGSGKTSLMPIWLLALIYQQKSGKTFLPRRLVWVINRRAVVDQATEIAELIAQKFAAPCEIRGILDSISVTGGLGVSTLRGEHEDNQEWSDDPSKPAIIVGTVDMVGSRLLFAGYGLSNRQRAQDAALLGNDVLLVNDEAQLSPAFARLIRLIEQARQNAEFPLMKPFYTTHISATLDQSSKANSVFQFDMDSESSEQFQNIYRAKKSLRLLLVNRADKTSKIVDLAVRGAASRTIVIVDTPTNVRRIAAFIRKEANTERVLTMTGTMRGFERDALANEPLFSHFTSPDVIATEKVWLVCTSAGESGVDMSCDLMITDFAPAERLIQRFGRLNRFGETTGEAVFVYSNEETEGELGTATLAYLKKLSGDISCRTISKNPPPPEACSSRPRLARLHQRDLQLLSYTSVRHSANKPKVDAFLHGEEAELPYAEVAWRAELNYLHQASQDDVETWLDVVRVRSHEKLREHTNIVRDSITSNTGDIPILVRAANGDVARYSKEQALQNALVILPVGCLGLSSGMLAIENDNAVYDVWNDQYGMRFLRQGDKYVHLGGNVFTEDQFEQVLNERGMRRRVTIPVGEDRDTELIYVETRPQKAKSVGDIFLDDHLIAVERNVRKLTLALGIPTDFVELVARAASLHDTGKAHPNWKLAFGNSGERHIAKLAMGKRTVNQRILSGLRHEFVSLLESVNEKPLVLQTIASHHKWGRPCFPQRGYDRRRSNEENRNCALEQMRHFVSLQKQFGIWGLAYFEAILRAADAQAGA